MTSRDSSPRASAPGSSFSAHRIPRRLDHSLTRPYRGRTLTHCRIERRSMSFGTAAASAMRPDARPSHGRFDCDRPANAQDRAESPSYADVPAYPLGVAHLSLASGYACAHPAALPTGLRTTGPNRRRSLF
jgi:hypothetical protein